MWPGTWRTTRPFFAKNISSKLRAGRIENLQLIEGHPMLVEAAINAVRQWQYKPFLLSGEPVEVETTVFVNFHIDR